MHIPKDFTEMTALWEHAKAQEQKWLEYRRSLETLMLAEIRQRRGEVHEGVVKHERVQVQFKLNRKWSQAKLARLASQIPPEVFPFSVHYKENRRFSKQVENDLPDTWQVISDALTLEPARPYISLIKKEGKIV